MNQNTSDTTPYILHINSLQRISGIPESFRIQLQYPILYCNRISLLLASIPNSLFVFNTSNTRGIRVNNAIDFIDSTGLQKNAFITPGTYDISALMAEIKTQMESVSPDTYTLTFNPNTLILTIASTSALFNLLWATGTNSLINCVYELGFNRADTGAALSHLGDKAVAIAGPLNLFIQVAELKNIIKDSQSFTANFCVPLDVEYGQYKYWKENSEYNSVFELPLKNITSLTVQLISDFGPVNMNGADWSCLLKFHNDRV